MSIDFQNQRNEAITTWSSCNDPGGLSMKAILLAVVVVSAVIGVFVYLVHTDPNRAGTQDAIAVLHEAAAGVPNEPAALGYLNLKKRQPAGPEGTDEFNGMYSAETAIQSLKQLQGSLSGSTTAVVEGTILKQEYLLRQAEYKLAQLKSLGGDIQLEELEKIRLAYAEATKRFQMFWDSRPSTD